MPATYPMCVTCMRSKHCLIGKRFLACILARTVKFSPCRSSYDQKIYIKSFYSCDRTVTVTTPKHMYPNKIN